MLLFLYYSCQSNFWILSVISSNVQPRNNLSYFCWLGVARHAQLCINLLKIGRWAPRLPTQLSYKFAMVFRWSYLRNHLAIPIVHFQKFLKNVSLLNKFCFCSSSCWNWTFLNTRNCYLLFFHFFIWDLSEANILFGL